MKLEECIRIKIICYGYNGYCTMIKNVYCSNVHRLMKPGNTGMTTEIIHQLKIFNPFSKNDTAPHFWVTIKS